MNKDWSHVNPHTGQINMVDITQKQPTNRTATAQAIVLLPAEVLEKWDGSDITSPKGAVLQTAITAGIMAAKKTPELIPLCHGIGMEHCHIAITRSDNALIIHCTTSLFAKTGVEMEALTGASVAALTIYDMCKALSHDITITDIKLLAKTGGKNDFKRN
ncbi:MAG: cyclic pyranopterin monophosphate synthase MoaC [Chitinophagia bacterium]|nr:cyclic pyranopterin monophosphate synthase MoaC [Chitinophagia bacterium]